jgi:hypothetical protein
MIIATMTPAPNSTSAERGTAWIATCHWDGRLFQAQSRTGASFTLCRDLLAAGCPDQPMDVRWEGKVALHIRSIHKAATRTIIENSSQPITEGRFQPYPTDKIDPALEGDDQNRG